MMACITLLSAANQLHCPILHPLPVADQVLPPQACIILDFSPILLAFISKSYSCKVVSQFPCQSLGSF